MNSEPDSLRVKQVFEKVRENDFYVDAPDGSKMVESAIGGMLASLDPHSTYFDPKALNEFQTTMKGEEFGGLGLEVMQDEGLVRVVSPIDDTPAARAGMLSGDLITKIDDTPVQGLSLKEAVDRMVALTEVMRGFEALQRGVHALNEMDSQAIVALGRRA